MDRPDPTGSLVYTHGTGTRPDEFARDWAFFRAQAEKYRFDAVNLIPCDWGRLRKGIPDPRLVESVVPGGQQSDFALEWELLIRDPLFELRLAAIHRNSTARAEGTPGLIATRLSSLDMAEVTTPGQPVLAAACRWVAGSQELADAERAATPEIEDHVARAAARASVAAALSRGQHWGRTDRVEAISPSLVAKSVTSIVEALGGEGARLTDPPWGPAFTEFARANQWPSRECLTQAAAEFFADVFWYVRSSEIVAGELATKIRDAQDNRPVVVVAHSLGGIAAVDLLSDPSRPAGLAVDMLVTFGMQAGLLYAMDALRYARLAGGEPSTAVIPRWLSFHGRGDYLSFRVDPIAGLAIETHDLEVDFESGFPGSHGEYIKLDVFWDQMRGLWPRG